MKTIELYIEAEFKLATKEWVDYLEWNPARSIPYQTNKFMKELDKDELIDYIDSYIASEIEADYGPSARIEFIYLSLTKAYDETNKKYRYFE